jgi:site-specific DNA-methyltransferase (adenine-specific)
MQLLPDKCVDLVLTDPPYGIGICSKKSTIGSGNLSKVKDYKIQTWDNDIPQKKIFDEILRISKNAIIFGGNYFVENLSNSSCWIVWDKDNGKTDFADCELAWTNFKSAVRKYKYRWNGMLQEYGGNMKEERYHPTQKPWRLFSQILKDYSKENDVIFDPFAGSGTTAIACLYTKRKYILCEKEKDYVNIINKRIQEYYNDNILVEYIEKNKVIEKNLFE